MPELQHDKIVSDSYGEIFGQVEKNQHQREKENRQREFDQKILVLADKAIEFEHKDENLYVLLESFLEVAIEMKNLMDSMSAINIAMETISDAVGFLDAALAFDDVLMNDSLQENYGFFARLKLKAKMRKTIRNNRGRMLAIANSLQMKYTMATDMMQALTKVSTGLKGSIAKKNKKKAKKGGNSTATTPSAAQLFMAERKKTNGGGDDTSIPGVSGSAIGGGSGSGIGDIGDIL